MLPRLTATPAAAATAAIVAAAVLFGLTPLFGRALQAQGFSDAAIAFYRFFFSALALAPFLPRDRARRREAAMMLGAGLAMGLAWLSYLAALQTQTVAAVGVIYMSYPLFAVLLGWALAGLRPTPRGVGACALILSAAALLLLAEGGGARDPLALAMALPAPLCFALIIVTLTLLTPSLNALEKMAGGMIGSTLGLAPLLAVAPAGSVIPSDGAGLALVAGLALATALVPQLLYTVAAPRVGPARAAAAGSFELPTMLAVGWLAFGERVGPVELAAAALVVAAMGLAPAMDTRAGAVALRSARARGTAP